MPEVHLVLVLIPPYLLPALNMPEKQDDQSLAGWL